jgi:hypothetical protein
MVAAFRGALRSKRRTTPLPLMRPFRRPARSEAASDVCTSLAATTHRPPPAAPATITGAVFGSFALALAGVVTLAWLHLGRPHPEQLWERARAEAVPRSVATGLAAPVALTFARALTAVDRFGDGCAAEDRGEEPR